MEEIKIKKLWDKGEKIYDDFLVRVFAKPRDEIRVSNPRTNTLELFALLEKRGETDILIRSMCRELAGDEENVSVFSEKGELFSNVIVREKY